MHARALLLLSVLGAGCADDDDPCAYAVCSIHSEACVERVAEAVACRRDTDVVVPPVRFLSVDEIIFELYAGETAPTEQELADERDYLAGLALMGLMPANYEPSQLEADALEGFIALYRRDTGEVIVRDDVDLRDDRLAYEVLVHEMVHVYQDAAWDLDALWEEHATTYDRSLALRAAVEGDAVLHELLCGLELEGIGSDRVDWRRYFDDFQAVMLEQARASAVPALDTFQLFPYAWGGELQHAAWEADDLDGIEDVVLQPPDSVRQVMRGFTSWPPVGINADAQLEPMAVPILPSHTFLGGGHESIWAMNAMLQRTAEGGVWESALDTVAADYLSVFREDATGEIVAVWRVAMEGQLAFPVTRGLWLGATSHAAFHEDGGDTILVSTSGADAAAAYAAITGWQSPEAAYADAADEQQRRQGPTREAPLVLP